MLRIVFFLLFIFFVSLSFAQKRKKLKAPPGTVQINDTLFADRTEIANVHYREYLWWLSEYDSLEYERMLPDTSVWGIDTSYHHYDSINGIEQTAYSNSPMMEYYFRHPGFNNYPAVGVSYEQAVRFCNWRSDRVNELIEKIPVNKRPFTKVYYRLPTRQEWEMLASCGLDSNTKYFKRYQKKNLTGFVFKTNEEIRKQNYNRNRHFFPTVFYTSPVNSYFINKYKQYHLIGNVSEMVLEKGIAKGGSFVHSLEESKISKNQYYTKPERWLGFRCVAVIVK